MVLSKSQQDPELSEPRRALLATLCLVLVCRSSPLLLELLPWFLDPRSCRKLGRVLGRRSRASNRLTKLSGLFFFFSAAKNEFKVFDIGCCICLCLLKMERISTNMNLYAVREIMV